MNGSFWKITCASGGLAVASLALWGDPALRDPRGWALFTALVLVLPWAWNSRRPSPSFGNPPCGSTRPRRSWCATMGLVLAPLLHTAMVLAQVEPAAQSGFPPHPVATGFLFASVFLWSPLLVRRLDSALDHLGLPDYLSDATGRPLFLGKQLFRINRMAGATLRQHFLKGPIWKRALITAAFFPPVFWGAVVVEKGDWPSGVWAPTLASIVIVPAVLLATAHVSLFRDPEAVAITQDVLDSGRRIQAVERARRLADKLDEDLPCPIACSPRATRL